MAIEVSLIRNAFRKDGALRPRVEHRGTATEAQLVEMLAKFTPLKEADVQAVVSGLGEALLWHLLRGEKIRTTVGTFSLSISGRYDDVRPRIDRDGLSIIFRPSRRFRRELRSRAEIQLVEKRSSLEPIARLVENIEWETNEHRALPGHLIRISGARLSFPPKDPQLGVFFVPEPSGSKVRTQRPSPGLTTDRDGPCGGVPRVETRATVYSRHGTNIIDCKVPAVPPGSYHIEVRTRPSGRVIEVGRWSNLLFITER